MYKKVSICLFVLLFTLVMPALALSEMVSVAKDRVNMRSGPGTNYKLLWILGEGYPMKVLKRQGDWLRVQDFEGGVGWIHKKLVNRTPHMIVKVYKNKNKRINIRSGPSTNNRIVAKSYYGVVFKTIKQEKGWVKVQHEQGVTGWIKRSLLWGF